MDLSNTISTTTNDLSVALDRNLRSVSDGLPGPVSDLVRRVGAVWVEALHQTGRVASVTIEVVEGIFRVVATGVSTVEGQTEALLRETGKAARDVGEGAVDAIRGAATEARETFDDATDRVRDLAESAGDEIERRFRVVEGSADKADDDIEDAIEEGAGRVIGAIDDAVEASFDAGAGAPQGPFEQWTKDELYERAQELDLQGRSTMNKRQLVTALRGA